MKSIQNLATIVMGIVMCLPMMVLASDDCGVCEEPSDPTLQGGKPCSPKPNGTACTINGKPGKCCGGICYEVPGEGEDPCDWANSHQSMFPQSQQQEVFGDPECFGYVLCLNGEKYPCTIDSHVAAAHSSWGSEILGCMKAHEQEHKDQGVTCPPCGVTAGTGPTSHEEADQLECEAFYKEWECLDALDELSVDGVMGATERVMCAMRALNCTNIPGN